MMKNCICIILGLLFVQSIVYGQDKRQVKIGDSLLQDYKVQLVHNGEWTTVKELQGNRNLIINFWGRRCKPCVRALPKLDSLQREFGNDMLILCVSPEEDIKVVKDFLDSKPLLRNLKLTFVINSASYTYNEDGVRTNLVSGDLYKDFMVGGLDPKKSWLDPDGIVRALTRPKEVNRENIAFFLSNGWVNENPVENK